MSQVLKPFKVETGQRPEDGGFRRPLGNESHIIALLIVHERFEGPSPKPGHIKTRYHECK